jgi:hypothetical protein
VTWLQGIVLVVDLETAQGDTCVSGGSAQEHAGVPAEQQQPSALLAPATYTARRPAKRTHPLLCRSTHVMLHFWHRCDPSLAGVARGERPGPSSQTSTRHHPKQCNLSSASTGTLDGMHASVRVLAWLYRGSLAVPEHCRSRLIVPSTQSIKRFAFVDRKCGQAPSVSCT